MPKPKPKNCGRRAATRAELALRIDIAIRARSIQDVLFQRPQAATRMAASLGVPTRTWHNNLTGRFALSGLTVLRLIDTHRVSAAWLLTGTGAMFTAAAAEPIPRRKGNGVSRDAKTAPTG